MSRFCAKGRFFLRLELCHTKVIVFCNIHIHYEFPTNLLTCFLQLIDLKRDPYGTMDQKKTTIKTNVTKKTPFQVMEDKVRIANKVNKKYQELLNDLEKDYKDACNELGPEEVAALLEKQLESKHEVKTNVPDTRKDGKY